MPQSRGAVVVLARYWSWRFARLMDDFDLQLIDPDSTPLQERRFTSIRQTFLGPARVVSRLSEIARIPRLCAAKKGAFCRDRNKTFITSLGRATLSWAERIFYVFREIKVPARPDSG